ncbi:MAG: DUF3160 domain-containing protein [bacterium]
MKYRLTVYLLIISLLPLSAFSMHADECSIAFSETGKSSFFDYYNDLIENNERIILTSDFLFYLEHLFLDYSLRYTEEQYLMDDFELFLSKAIDMTAARYGDCTNDGLRDSYERIMAYLYVPLKILNDDTVIPPAFRDYVSKEISLINAQAFNKKSPVFMRKEDYTQYKPRGHYTSSEELKKYFKAMMWLQRMRFEADADIPDRHLFTRCIVMLADITETKQIKSIFAPIDDIISFYLPRSDDITFTEAYGLFPGEIKDENLLNNELLDDYVSILRANSDAVIRSDILADTDNMPLFAGLMGQRYIFDSHLFTELVYPAVGKFTGTRKDVFTLGSGVRLFPRSLDLFYLIGSRTAGEILTVRQDNAYENYNKQLNGMKAVYEQLGDNNLYNKMLAQYSHMLKTDSDICFMNNELWKYKTLNTVLASWAYLRHDVILYAKQSYTAKITSAKPMPEKKIYFIAEPYIELYSIMKNDMEFISEKLSGYTGDSKYSDASDAIVSMIELQTQIGEKTVKGKASERSSDVKYALSLAERALKRFLSGSSKEENAVMIADIHTDPNSKQVLEVGTGRIMNMHIEQSSYVYTGGIIPFYEFKQPADKRLTDGEWRNMIKNNENDSLLRPWQELLFEDNSR